MTPPQIPCDEASPPGLQAAVAGLWREVLGHDGPLRPTDNFFALGGDSLTMMLFLFRAQETFGVELSPATMLDAAELHCVCRALEQALAETNRMASSDAPAHPPSA